MPDRRGSLATHQCHGVKSLSDLRQVRQHVRRPKSLAPTMRLMPPAMLIHAGTCGPGQAANQIGSPARDRLASLPDMRQRKGRIEASACTCGRAFE